MKTTKTIFAVFTIVAALALQVHAQSFLTNGLVAYYPFKGNANDETGGGRNGTVHGATFTSDRFGNSNNAYLFNGSSSYIDTYGDGLSTNDRTISIWLKRTEDVGGSPWKVMLGYGGNGSGPSSCYPAIQGNTLHLGPHWGGGLYATVAVVPNTWHHYVVTVNGSNGKLYWDGLPLETTGSPFPSTYIAPGSQLLIGVDVWANGLGPYTDSNVGYWAGSLDDIRIYNRAMSSNEVAQLYAIEYGPRVDLIKAAKPAFSILAVGINYQMQISADMSAWTNYGTPFTATNASMVYPQYWDVDNWGKLFFRVQVAP
jgi:hypothetical protein